MRRRRVNIVSLGCSKNLVDSERLMKMLSDAGFETVHDGDWACGAFLTVVNTCGFIGDAKEESVNAILQAVEAKESGLTEQVAVMGCLSQRYADDLPPEIPGVDYWFGKTDWPQLVAKLGRQFPASAPYDRIITTPRHHAYLKIAEGCNRFCAFCAIPLITGRYQSRPIDEILDEVKMLVSRGVKEFNVIAQDLSNYGYDLDGRSRLADLIDRMADIEGIRWIRLHYAYPADFPMDILDVMSRRDNVCSYIDIALQHCSDKVLKNMRRHIDKAQTLELLAEMRRRVPGLHVRTTLMVGFPGEGDREFDELLEFVRECRFERMGAFAYCEEDDTYAAKTYDDSIPDEVKQQRLDRLMALQEEISMEIQLEKVGRTFRCVIDREDDEFYIGRTEFDSPEVDPEVLVRKTEKLKVGDFYDVVIEEALPFELIGRKA